MDLLFDFFRYLTKVVIGEVVAGLTEAVCFWVGKYALRILSFGYYPNDEQCYRHEGRISLFGLLLIASLVIYLLWWLST